MNERDDRRFDGAAEGDAVRFGDRLIGSDGFLTLFSEGMALVEETAAYLDSDGRDAARLLSRVASLTYATESMRLTTRLMQLASWLLLQRSVNEGEMTMQEARREKAKVRLQSLSSATHGPDYEQLPEKLRALIDRSMRLQDRIETLDNIFYGASARETPPVGNPVADHMARLSSVFGAKDEASGD
ncbi:MAG: DUF1465 family protein [Hyphomicrobiaceae bacterium]|nr:DUF1465 family protein [Hyphomicrobiaceae bacterium]